MARRPSAGCAAGRARLLAHLYGTRVDLQKAFPDLAGPDLGRLLSGRVTRVVQTSGARPPVAARERASSPVGAPGTADRSCGGSTWSATSALSSAWARPPGRSSPRLTRAACRCCLCTAAAIAQPPGPRLHSVRPSRRAVPGEPDLHQRRHAARLRQSRRRAFFAGRYSIGMWFWEVSRFRREWHGSFDLVDEVWAPTAHVADALTPISPIPVVTMRVPVQMPAIVPRSRAELGPAGGLSVPVLVRLSQRLRTQEPAGGGRGVFARVRAR